MRKPLFVVFFLVSSIHSFSQNVFFEKVFGTPGSDFARAVKQTDSGDIFIGGYSDSGSFGGFDISVSKLSRAGDLVWTKYYGGNYTDYGLYLNKVENGSLVVAGETYDSTGESDVIVINIDTAGNIIWQKVFIDSLYQSAKYVEQTADGGFILSGFKSDGYGSNDILVLKLDSVGNKQWEKAIGGTDVDYSDMIHQTEDKGYILTSDTRSWGAGGIDIEVTRLDSLGNIVWDNTFGDALQNGCQGILVTSDKKYLSYGETNVRFNYSPFDFYLEKLDTNGTSIWQKVFGDAGSDAVFSAVETQDKGFMLTGYSSSYNSGPIDLVILKTDSVGDLQWVQTYGDSGIDIGYDIIPSIDNGFLITGKTFVNDDQYYLLHLNDQGLTGLKPEKRENHLSVYPNPCRSAFNLVFPSDIKISGINIFSEQGKLINNCSFNGRQVQLSKDQRPGLYFIQAITDKGIFYTKFMVLP